MSMSLQLSFVQVIISPRILSNEVETELYMWLGAKHIDVNMCTVVIWLANSKTVCSHMLTSDLQRTVWLYTFYEEFYEI